ncbi:hypothetical protein FBUS_05431 [Fasciolopsis buskii]|uniref:Uncharacterized protein n=1 Tax=Fasciolopsis buskii TaxID=27845 RepID=A0A8E0S8T2_9TREM|nr:hypothetical protein FBUS_05431 [Fasciolopsis buski]
METLDSRWIHVRGDDCERTETSPATLGLTNMAGVFIMVAAGILTGLPISMAEIACRKRRRMEERQSVVAIAAVRRWRENIRVSSAGTVCMDCPRVPVIPPFKYSKK